MKMYKKKIWLLIITAILIYVCYYWLSNFHNKTLIINQISQFYTMDFKIQPSFSLCKDRVFIVILVTSYAGHVELRSAHRRAMPSNLLSSMNVTRIFLLSSLPKHEKFISQPAIEDESNSFGDILQGSFVEHYRNLTHKHLMGLQWAASSCSRASYILKVDDDTVFSIEKTFKLIKNLNDINDNFLLGYMLNNTKPKRNKQNKWYVTMEEYSNYKYPKYLSGWYYITTPRVAAQLCFEANKHPYFWIDDIFVTGILTESINLKIKQLPHDYWLEYYELLECCINDMVKYSIDCSYGVGPNGNRNNLIVEYNKALKICYKNRNCTKRPLDRSLKKDCVAFKERSIYSEGHGEIKYLGL